MICDYFCMKLKKTRKRGTQAFRRPSLSNNLQAFLGKLGHQSSTRLGRLACLV